LLQVARFETFCGTVATVGFPNIGLQGFAPKLAKGEIASLSGAGDDARYFQISVPVQPGNSGGALVDERGNVVGVVSAKLSARAALAASGSLPENVNYAVKSSFLLGFLESVPEVSAKLKEPNTKERKFEDVVKSAEQAAVLVLVY
jgi:S1-C subfamily serine protease